MLSGTIIVVATMSDREVQIIDVKVDKKDPQPGILKLMSYIRPAWKEQDIVFEVRSCLYCI